MHSLSLKPGLRVLVTAGASGIGRAIADALIENGAQLHICDVSPEHLADFRQTHPDHGASLCDVADEEEVASLFEDVSQSLGGLDALVNNAGVAGPTGGVEHISPADWRRTIDVGLTGQFLCTHHAVPLLREVEDGAIINLSSAAGRFGYAFRTPYAAAKWGVIGFTQSLAKELGPAGIRVNAVLPGAVSGPRMQGVIRNRAAQLGLTEAEMETEIVEHISLRRMARPEDLAAMVLFLLGPGGFNISGQSLSVDGNTEAI
jgi:NAD(P)-dependent dehydrogenase (short-subunit alcohol dehydrogenase family)